MAPIRIEERSLAELNAAFAQLESVVQSPRRVLQRIGAYQERQFAIAFEQERSPQGQPWAPLAPSTRARKRNSKTLVETVGRIPSSLFYEVNSDGRSVQIGYADPLATIHHHGAQYRAMTIRARNKRALFWTGARHPVRQVNIPPRTLPARPLVGASTRDVARWVAIAEQEALKAWDP